MKILNSRVLIIGIGVLLIGGSLLGQEEYQKRRGDRSTRMKVGNSVEKMSEALNLTAEQEAEIKGIMKSSKMDRKEQQQVDRTQVETQILEVLTTEQQVAFNELKAQREERLANRKEARTAIMEFREKSIEPFIHQKRVELESVLTEEEKSSLDRIRSLKSDIDIRGDRNRKGRNADRQRLSKEDRKVLKEISEKHVEDIDRLQRQIEENQASWNKEIQAIREAYQMQDDGMQDDGMQEEGIKREAKREERKGKQARNGEKGKGKNIRFLLMDIGN
ncbi:MAG: hypothetical protein ACJA01_002445 [Saprospiraceae bacterium]|jgi:hypothetical protein